MSTEVMEKQEQISQKVDLDSLDANLVEETIDINPEANPMEEPPPVEDGTWRAKVLVVDDSWEHKETKENKSGNKTAYLTCKASLAIIDEGGRNNNKRVFIPFLSTLVFDGKCEMAYLLIQMLGGGQEAKQEVSQIKNYVNLAKRFKEVAAGEPTVKVATKWVAQYQDGVDEKTGKNKYRVAVSGMKNFPPVPGSTPPAYRHIFNHKQSGQEVKARSEIQDYFPDK